MVGLCIARVIKIALLCIDDYQRACDAMPSQIFNKLCAHAAVQKRGTDGGGSRPDVGAHIQAAREAMDHSDAPLPPASAGARVLDNIVKQIYAFTKFSNLQFYVSTYLSVVPGIFWQLH